MSIRNLFANQLPRLQRQRWGRRINGQDPGVHELAEEVYAILGAEEPIVLDAPIKITRNYDGPVFEVGDAAGTNAAPAVPAPPGNTDLVASINSPVAVEYNVPGTDADMPNPFVVIEGGDGSLFQPPLVLIEPDVASTVEDVDFPPVSIQDSELPQVFDLPPGGTTTVVGAGQGQSAATSSRMVRSTITAIGDDTITINYINPFISTGDEANKPIQALKPYYLRRSTFDGKTVDGLTYTYSDAQTREVTDGDTTETQTVLPLYKVGDEILVILTDDLTMAVSADGGLRVYSDLNTDGRQWATDPTAGD